MHASKCAMIPGFWAGNFRRYRLRLFWVLVAVGRAAETTPNPRDTLVYKDGDRVQGTFVEVSDELIHFNADRFGELRVKATEAVVIRAEKAAKEAVEKAAAAGLPIVPALPITASTTPEKHAAQVAADKDEQERVTVWDRFSPAVLTAHVRNYFGPWHGRIAASTEVVSDVAERNNSSYEAHLLRKWKADEVQLNARYDYSETDDLVTTDLVKVWGQWRHEFTQAFFALYRPTSEWNRASKFRGLPNDYVLLQQEIGVGYHILTKPSRKLRAGVSQNLFDTWNTAPGAEHTSRGVVSTFEEFEFTLPWRITLSQRGVWYPVSNQNDGWENRFELQKKLTETLSTSLRHEIRRHNPDGTAQDYDRLKLLFGLDF
jgi:hypothetical protein